jgi:hypothetical protein
MNTNSYNPYNHQSYKWNGLELVPVETGAEEIRNSIRAHRGNSIFSPVHIPVEKINE